MRTYVHDDAGVPGVWFYSLDANQWLAVKIARRFFHLPYEHAVMKSNRATSGAIHYRSTPQGQREADRVSNMRLARNCRRRHRVRSSFSWSNATGFTRARTVACFAARFSMRPYPLCQAEVTAWDDRLFALDGFSLPPAARLITSSCRAEWT